MKRVLASLLLLLTISSAAWAHPMQSRQPQTPAEGARETLDREAIMKAARLGPLINELRRLAGTYVSDLNDRVNGISQQADRLNRQRQLYQMNLQNGFGMPRWTPEVYVANAEAAYNEAVAVLEQYKKRLPTVTVTITREGVTVDTATEKPTLLAGRTEYVLVQILNQTPQSKPYTISGEFAGQLIRFCEGTSIRGLTTHALVPLHAEEPGEFRLQATLTLGEESHAIEQAITVKPGHRLTLNIIDATTGRPCAARAYVQGSDGRYIIEGDRTLVLAGQKKILTFGYVDGQMQAVLPPGEVTLTVRKGFEYEIAEQTVDLQNDMEVTVELERWVNMPAQGWYSGDTHVHWVRHTWHENGDPEWLNVHSRAEDLWVNNNLILRHWWKNVVTEEFPQGLVANRPDMFPVGKVEHLSTNGRIVWTGEEYRNDEVFGHMNFLRIDKLIEPVSTGFMGGPDAVHYPPNSFTYDAVHAAGGIVIAAHDVTKEVPIQVILNKLDVLDAHTTTHYYNLLNCGFRVPIGIGSDYPANIMGFARVYVDCDDSLDYDTWVDRLAEGRTFVSSGTMLLFKADEQHPGGTIEIGENEQRTITVRGEATCRNPLADVQIVHNGLVVKTIKPPQGQRHLEFEEELIVEGPGWIAARVLPPGTPNWWGHDDAAHTGAVYIKAGDRRLVQRQAVERLINVLRSGKNAAATSQMYANAQQKIEVLNYYDDGIRRYEELLDQVE